MFTVSLPPCHLLYQDGVRFWQIAECYVRGGTIKYIRIPPQVRAVGLLVCESRSLTVPAWLVGPFLLFAPAY